ncbi:hypothetical protein [Neorhizobium petrolearium]|uniref:hypothetical protein n=1 Tax=Neorhizobium petrolearium TaxID=515361 RepID=UPI003F80476C
MRDSRVRFAALAATVSLCVLSGGVTGAAVLDGMFGAVAHAAEQGPASGGNGFFTQKIGIDVPAFRGLEPKIALSCSSARKTRLGGLYQGWRGYAWGLDGFDVIERASPGVACRGLISEG